MTNKITREDVISIGNSINKTLTEKEISWVLENYESYENDEPQSTWDLIVERMLYDMPTTTFQFHFDQKVTTWMRTEFEIDAIDEEEAKLKALEFVKEDKTSEMPWNEIRYTKETMSVEDNFGNPTEELYTSSGDLIYQNDKED
jgi:hypothetical protein